MEYKDIDPATCLLEVRQAYEMSDEDLALEARAALERVGGLPLEMRLAEVVVVREWIRRRLERAVEAQEYAGLHAQFDLLCHVLHDHIPPLS